MSSRVLRIRWIPLLLAGAASAFENPEPPVHVYMFGRFSDFVNIELTERQIRESLHLIDRYSQKHGDLHVSATILFSGALSQAIEERNGQTGIKDYIADHVKRGVIELGYDGTDEPTYHRRPLPEAWGNKTPEERWLSRVNAMDRFLTQSRDISGIAQKGKSGGLQAMQQVFGEAVCITGLTEELGGDSEFVHALRRHNTKAIMWGIPDPDPARNIHGYRGSAAGFGTMMSPGTEFSTELNWVDNVLRSSETSDASVRVVSLAEGPEAIKGVFGKMTRKNMRIVHIEVGDVRAYLTEGYRSGAVYPPLRLAYNHPDRPQLPPDAIADDKEVGAAIKRQEDALEWLATQFLPANKGSRFLSSTDLKRMVSPVIGETISVAELETAAREFLKTSSRETYLPDYIQAGDQYLSLADSFYVLTSILAEQHRTGNRPSSVRIAPVFGPLETLEEHGPSSGTVPAASVNRMCATLATRLDDQSWRPMPANMIPTWLEIDGLRINGAQFLKLMFESLAAPSLDTKINVRLTNMFSAAGLVCPKMRMQDDQGGTWTFRPARIDMSRLTVLKSQR